MYAIEVGPARSQRGPVPKTGRPIHAVLTRHEVWGSPEHSLMLAVLEHALRCYLRQLNRPDRRSRRLFRETEEWFASEDATWPFSFVPICEKLVLDPDYFRKGLLGWRSGHPARRETGPPPMRQRRADATVARC